MTADKKRGARGAPFRVAIVRYAQTGRRAFLRRIARPMPPKPRSIRPHVPGSGTAPTTKFRSPVLVPAVERVIATPAVSEYGLTEDAKAPLAEPEYAAPVSGPTDANKFAPEKLSAVLLVPPHARPVTDPLPPELVPPSVSKN